MDKLTRQVKKARAGDKEELVSLVVRRKDQLYRIAWSYLHNQYDANDALQETIVKAFREIVNLKNPKYFYTWYIRILINTCKQALRKKQKVVSIEQTKQQSKEKSYGEEDQMDLQKGMDLLPEKYREIIFMRYMEDLPVKDIAEILNLPMGTVKSRIHYGIKKLRDFVGERKVKQNEM